MRPACSARGTCCSCSTSAETVEARVVLVGDRRQHRGVAAGEPLKLLEEKAGLPVAEVTEILRQTGDYKKARQGAERRQDGRGLRRTGQARLDQGSARCASATSSWPLRTWRRSRKRSRTARPRRPGCVARPTPKATASPHAIRDALKAEGQARRGTHSSTPGCRRT